MNTDEAPIVENNQLEFKNIDDSVMFSLMTRARMSGYDSYLLPHPSTLPMANRREDLLFSRP